MRNAHIDLKWNVKNISHLKLCLKIKAFFLKVHTAIEIIKIRLGWSMLAL